MAGNTKTGFDPAGEVSQITDHNGIVTTYSYDASGNRTQANAFAALA